MKNQKPLIETVFGVILLIPNDDAIGIFNRIKPTYLETTFQKRVYESISELIKAKTWKIDAIGIINVFRQNNWFDSKTALEISNLTSGVLSAESMLYVESIFFELENQFMFKQAMAIRNKIDQMVESGNLTIEKFHEILEMGKDVQFNFKTEQSNVDCIFEIIDDAIKAKNGQNPGIDIGYHSLKNVIELENVDVMVVGARPSMGKTAWAISTICRMIMQGRTVVFFSLEMSKKQIMRRIISNLANVDSNRIRFGELTTSDFDRIYAAQSIQQLDNLIIFDGSHSLNDIAAKLNDVKCKRSVDVWIVDYLQKIQPKTTRSRYEAVTEISNGVKMLTMNTRIPCIALAQLSRAVAERGGDRRPILSDLKESGEIEQDASIVTFLHRPEYYGISETANGMSSENVCEFIIAKNRDGVIGIYEQTVDLKTSKFV